MEMAVRGAERPQEPRPGGEGPKGGQAAERPAWGPSSGPERLCYLHADSFTRRYSTRKRSMIPDIKDRM